MVKTEIFGFKITVSTNNIHIEDSYLCESTIVMRELLNELHLQLDECHMTMDTPFNHRSVNSMVNEWVSHNNCYKLGIAPDRTASVDLNYPQPWYMPIVYWLTSRIVL